MKLICCGSSSEGNLYVLRGATQSLVLEAGLPLRTLLRAVDYDSLSIAGCIVSHNHGDHDGFADQYSMRGISIYGNDNFAAKHHATALPPDEWTRIGEYSVRPFLLKHDVPNYGYLIRHREMGTLMFGTDTYAYPKVFRGCDWYLVEANYSDDLLSKSRLDRRQKERLLLSHMSLDYTIDYLRKCQAEKSTGIVLVHLSSRHSSELQFKSRVESEFGVPVIIADRDVSVLLDKMK